MKMRFVATTSLLVARLASFASTVLRLSLMSSPTCPDVLALQEANGFDAPPVLASFKERLGLGYHAISTPPAYVGDGEVYNLVALSRYPITKTMLARWTPV